MCDDLDFFEKKSFSDLADYMFSYPIIEDEDEATEILKENFDDLLTYLHIHQQTVGMFEPIAEKVALLKFLMLEMADGMVYEVINILEDELQRPVWVKSVADFKEEFKKKLHEMYLAG